MFRRDFLTTLFAAVLPTPKPVADSESAPDPMCPNIDWRRTTTDPPPLGKKVLICAKLESGGADIFTGFLDPEDLDEKGTPNFKIPGLNNEYFPEPEGKAVLWAELPQTPIGTLESFSNTAEAK